MVNQSVQITPHAANCLQVSGVVVHFPKLFAVVMESIAAQTDIPVMLKLGVVPKETRLQYQCQRISKHLRE